MTEKIHCEQLINNDELVSAGKQQIIALDEQPRQRVTQAIGFRSPLGWPVV